MHQSTLEARAQEQGHGPTGHQARQWRGWGGTPRLVSSSGAQHRVSSPSTRAPTLRPPPSSSSSATPPASLGHEERGAEPQPGQQPPGAASRGCGEALLGCSRSTLSPAACAGPGALPLATRGLNGSPARELSRPAAGPGRQRCLPLGDPREGGPERTRAPRPAADLGHGDVDDLRGAPARGAGLAARVQEDVAQGVQAALQRGLTPGGDGGEVEALQGFYLGGQALGDRGGWLAGDTGAIGLGARQLAVGEKLLTGHSGAGGQPVLLRSQGDWVKPPASLVPQSFRGAPLAWAPPSARQPGAQPGRGSSQSSFLATATCPLPQTAPHLLHMVPKEQPPPRPPGHTHGCNPTSSSCQTLSKRPLCSHALPCPRPRSTQPLRQTQSGDQQGPEPGGPGSRPAPPWWESGHECPPAPGSSASEGWEGMQESLRCSQQRPTGLSI